MCWVIRLERNLSHGCGTASDLHRLPPVTLVLLSLLSCRRILLANRKEGNSPRALQAAPDRVIVGIWNIDALAVLECMSQRLLTETGLPMAPK